MAALATNFSPLIDLGFASLTTFCSGSPVMVKSSGSIAICWSTLVNGSKMLWSLEVVADFDLGATIFFPG